MENNNDVLDNQVKIEDLEQNQQQKPKTKQKAGLNGVRLEDWMEDKFKEDAKKYGSQTKYFEHIYLTFLGLERDSEKEKALNLNSDVELLSKDMQKVMATTMDHLKGIVDKAQNTIISLKSNAEQTEINLKTDLDTANKKILELEKRNNELEESNNAFSTVKQSLEDKAKESEDLNTKLKEELNASKLENADLLKVNSVLRDTNTKLDAKFKELTEKNTKQDAAIDKLDKENTNNLNKIKDLEEKLKTVKAEKIGEIRELQEKHTKDLGDYKKIVEDKVEIQIGKAVLEADRMAITAEKKSLEYLNTINSKNLEITELKKALELEKKKHHARNEKSPENNNKVTKKVLG